MRTINRDIVSALVFSADGKLFQAWRTDTKRSFANYWHIPGGGIEEGEDKKDALIREIREELGIDISNCPIELVDDSGGGESERTLPDGEKVFAKMKYNVYKVQLDKPASEINIVLDTNEFEKYQWVELSELKNIQITPPSQVLFKRLGYI